MCVGFYTAMKSWQMQLLVRPVDSIIIEGKTKIHGVNSKHVAEYAHCRHGAPLAHECRRHTEHGFQRSFRRAHTHKIPIDHHRLGMC